jgi:hypothetical protein
MSPIELREFPTTRSQLPSNDWEEQPVAMRRLISRRPSGLRILPSERPIGCLTSQCAALRAPLSTVSSAAPKNSIRTAAAGSRTRTFSTQLPLRLDSNGRDSILEAQYPTQEEALLDQDGEESSANLPFKVPPKRLLRAKRVGEIEDPTYLPATSAKGLKQVGELENWWDDLENWGEAGSIGFMRFKPRKEVHDKDLVEAGVQRAVAEALTLRQLGREDELVATWPLGGEAERLRALSVRVETSEQGDVNVVSGFEQVADDLTWKNEVVQEDSETAEPFVAAEVADETKEIAEDELETAKQEELTGASESGKAIHPRKAGNPSWKRFSLDDSRLKFAVRECVSLVNWHWLTRYSRS